MKITFSHGSMDTSDTGVSMLEAYTPIYRVKSKEKRKKSADFVLFGSFLPATSIMGYGKWNTRKKTRYRPFQNDDKLTMLIAVSNSDRSNAIRLKFIFQKKIHFIGYNE